MSTSCAERAVIAASGAVALFAVAARFHDVAAYPALHDWDASGHAVNVLVMSPGGYSFRDYVKVGLPLTVILSVVVLIVLPVVWGL